MEKISLIFVLFIYQLSFANANVKEDSLKSKFDMNDPRNPNCPCHKYQKLADEEYIKLLAKAIKLNPENNKSNFNNSFVGKFRSIKLRHGFFDHKKEKKFKKKKNKKVKER